MSCSEHRRRLLGPAELPRGALGRDRVCKERGRGRTRHRQSSCAFCGTMATPSGDCGNVRSSRTLPSSWAKPFPGKSAVPFWGPAVQEFLDGPEYQHLEALISSHARISGILCVIPQGRTSSRLWKTCSWELDLPHEHRSGGLLPGCSWAAVCGEPSFSNGDKLLIPCARVTSYLQLACLFTAPEPRPHPSCKCMIRPISLKNQATSHFRALH